MSPDEIATYGTDARDQALPIARQYCTFGLGDLTIGIEVTCVHEVIRQTEMTEVPLAPALVQGLMNLRGQIVPVLDVRDQLGLPAEEPLAMNVVVRSGDELLSILVDRAKDVLSPPEEDFEPVPPVVPAKARALVSGVFKLDSRLMLVLDTAKVLDPREPVEPIRRPA